MFRRTSRGDDERGTTTSGHKEMPAGRKFKSRRTDDENEDERCPGRGRDRRPRRTVSEREAHDGF